MSEVIKSKRKMRPGRGKSKGTSFEGLVAKKLSAALPINFIRSPGSGARIGGKNFATVGAMMGVDAIKLFNTDVVPVNEKEAGYTFKFSCECKFYATADNFTALMGDNSLVFKWFAEAVEDAKKVEREPALIFKWNRTPIFVAVRATATTLQPKLQLIKGEHLAIFELEDLLKEPDFWVSKTE